jgi:hypothetical protein
MNQLIVRGAEPAFALVEQPPGRYYPGSTLSTLDCALLARSLVGGLLKTNSLLLMAKARGPRRMAFARQLAIHLVHIIAGRKHDEVARAFNRNRTTASHHFEVIEDLRDVPEFDTFMRLLEAKYALLLQFTELRAGIAWRVSLKAMNVAVEIGYLEGDAHRAAEYVAETFREPA